MAGSLGLLHTECNRNTCGGCDSITSVLHASSDSIILDGQIGVFLGEEVLQPYFAGTFPYGLDSALSLCLCKVNDPMAPRAVSRVPFLCGGILANCG
jgi:hypothetical protein